MLATILGPILAVQAQKYLERSREKQASRDRVFRTLMATRAARVSAEHVQALNTIDLAFYGSGNKEKLVRTAWRAYLDHLGLRYANDAATQWGIKRDELFFDLLHAMAQSLSYDFDKTYIKNSSYSPIAHGDSEKDLEAIRVSLAQILSGKKLFPVWVRGVSEGRSLEAPDGAARAMGDGV